MTNASHSYENIKLEDHKGESNSKKPSRKQGHKVEKIKDYDNGDIDIDEKIHMENPYGDLYLNVKAMKEISISNLWNIIVENSTNENDGFKKEYAVSLMIYIKLVFEVSALYLIISSLKWYIKSTKKILKSKDKQIRCVTA